MNLAHLLLRSARIFPEAPALYLGERLLWSYAELAARAGSLARCLKERLGVAPGDRVALFMSNVPEYLEILHATWMAGGVAVPINAKLHPKEAAFILQNSTPRVLFVSADLAASVAPFVSGVAELRHTFVAGSAEYTALSGTTALTAPVPRDSQDIAWLFYTSGTTGQPKGVMLTHRNLLTMTMSYFTDLDTPRPQDAYICAAPLSHGAGLYELPQMLAGARHVMPESAGFDPEELTHLANHHRSACMFAAPTMVQRLVDRLSKTGGDPEGFRTIVYGGGPMYVEDLQRAREVMGDRFAQIYGQGESPMTITALSRHHLSDRAHPRHAHRIASVGVAQTPVEVRVADSFGQPCAPDEIGEVLVRGATVMRGYWNNPKASAETLRNGWLWTGDLGSMDRDGFLTLRDRSKDLIISGGSNIYPREVEEVLLKHPAVQEVAVVGRRNPQWGEEVTAFVVSRPGERPSAEELDALCLNHIARFKRPKGYHFVASLPKNNYGKVLKSELRDRLAEVDA
jgi:long-chain acyl-CoA synthetase